uniref:phosphoglucomutase (alpha-D-glucose-1,6-bisphosphate-dependent) n=1 Tax=Pyramimonas obovata TaxID=1411642 RepID=A0A7S0QM37_9CHLO|mmetsp:Transcript_10485/g.21816  ORF Transcript_10485/g.21816 Transcript_10485/m.21816 type:complete len:632 (+) Transcript_10485:121-2016(+)|eukprot:CAMPEP_0118936106 /NCGR_PEP_ID=MMETSP1169-20130426/16011_1 /TAXON_ID=36882 /ORGANISM="Pyramimonas obovata, Strain CCMP722" /LENGTH=631 /DNA_ID=CAMNT_0006879219 /DNA_START=95 /DNA_END=1990 /DNA_ORIENTATION=-
MGARKDAPASDADPRSKSGALPVGQLLNPVRLLGGLVGLLRGGDPLEVQTIKTTPYDGQKPGTSGLRKKTKVFTQENYLANFVQSTFSALQETGVKVEGGTLVVSGDGRYYNSTAIQIIAKIAFAHGVARIWIGDKGLLSTPAVSAVIRNREGGFKAFGAFILTASHNPGGKDEDFGIKYNSDNGGPAPEKLTNAIYKYTTTISEIKMCPKFPTINIHRKGTATVKSVSVDVFDCTEDHINLLKQCFDIPKIKALIQRKDFKMKYDAMHGVQGPYAKKVFVELLGAHPSSLMNCDPKEDFGGPSTPSHGHADPNLKNAVELCKVMGILPDGHVDPAVVDPPSFGAAADGDADRNMILGSKFFCTPSDSLAIIVYYAQRAIPYFKDGVKGASRSMPTSQALDHVAKKLGIPLFEVPTGWKFFGNLMDSKAVYGKTDYTPFICGEESFGTGSDHVREKDGMWAVLAWLAILAYRNPDPAAPLVGVEQVATEFWAEFGRNYYVRYDYEGVDKGKAEEMMERMRTGAAKKEFDQSTKGQHQYTTDDFTYTDPVDGSVSPKQGIRILFADGSRVVFRLSGTGVVGATIRMYLETYVGPTGAHDEYAPEKVKALAETALQLSLLEKITGRKEPTVIT